MLKKNFYKLNAKAILLLIEENSLYNKNVI